MDLKVLGEKDVLAAIDRSAVREALREAFRGLSDNRTIQPAQTITPFPEGRGDCIFYPGAIWDLDIVGVKLSPYIAAREPGGKPTITAYTLLLSATTGEPVVLCDSLALTTLRTAATTALALEYLTPPTARKLAVIGSGRVALEHLRFVAGQHEWQDISVWSRSLGADGTQAAAAGAQLATISPKAAVAPSLQEAVADADVVMLCTSSAKPVVQLSDLPETCVVTSISTNAPRAHEIEPASLPHYAVFCDYEKTAPVTAGEMVLAIEAGIWSPDKIRGDIAGLVTGNVRRPERGRVFFRSTGLGLEDLAVANLLR